MIKKIILVLFLIKIIIINAQEKLYYNLALNNCKERKKEYVINKCLKASYLLNYDFKTIKNEIISTDKVKKPILLIVVSKKFAPCWALVPAINKMAEKYSNKIKFLMIFKDSKNGIKKMSKTISKNIKLIPSTKALQDKAYFESFGFIHKLDYPTLYLIGNTKKIIDIKRGAEVPTKTKKWDFVTKKNIENLEKFLSPVL